MTHDEWKQQLKLQHKSDIYYWNTYLVASLNDKRMFYTYFLNYARRDYLTMMYAIALGS